jgi:uncharacterized protein (TIGR02145 family)
MANTKKYKVREYKSFTCKSFCQLLFLMIFFSCKDDSIQKKTFNEVKIHNQTWMSEDLNITHFRNGDKILHASTNKQWKNALSKKIPAWCHYRLKSKNGAKYIKLYNCYAVLDKRGLAPSGWHIPSTKEWDELASNINPQEMMCPEAKWLGKVNNKSGFSAWPVSGRHENGTFDNGLLCNWWCSKDAKWYTLTEAYEPKNYVLWEDAGSMLQGLLSISPGFPVRCIKN